LRPGLRGRDGKWRISGQFGAPKGLQSPVAFFESPEFGFAELAILLMRLRASAALCHRRGKAPVRHRSEGRKALITSLSALAILSSSSLRYAAPRGQGNQCMASCTSLFLACVQQLKIKAHGAGIRWLHVSDRTTPAKKTAEGSSIPPVAVISLAAMDASPVFGRTEKSIGRSYRGGCRTTEHAGLARIARPRHVREWRAKISALT
jgi:hypothetical protein